MPLTFTDQDLLDLDRVMRRDMRGDEIVVLTNFIKQIQARDQQAAAAAARAAGPVVPGHGPPVMPKPNGDAAHADAIA